jgi:hypothetical protein
MNSDQISASIHSGYLKLNRKEKLRHYKWAFPIMAAGCVIPLILWDVFYISWNALILWTAFVLVLVAVLLIIQWFRLRIEMVETTLSQKQLNAILRTVGKSRGWVRYRGIKECYVARIPRPQGTKGEMVTVLFSENRIFINSIPEPKGNISVSSYRQCRNSVHILKKVIRNRQTGR